MELFLPSLIVLVLSAFFAFFVIPRTGVMILAVVCLLALLAAGIHHYSTFYSEYQLSTWQNGLQENAIFIILGFALLFIVGAITFMFQGPSSANVSSEETPMETLQNAVANAATNMPSANSATNAVTSAINSGLQSAMGAVSGATEALTGAVNKAKNTFTGAVNQAKNLIPGAASNNQKKGPSPLIPGLNFRASEI